MSSFTLIIQFSQNAKVSVHVPATQGNMKVLQHSSYTYTHWLVFIWGFSSHKYKCVLIFLPDIYINECGTNIRIAHEKFRLIYLKKDLTSYLRFHTHFFAPHTERKHHFRLNHNSANAEPNVWAFFHKTMNLLIASYSYTIATGTLCAVDSIQENWVSFQRLVLKCAISAMKIVFLQHSRKKPICSWTFLLQITCRWVNMDIVKA